MSSEVDIRIRNLSKVYRIYERPEDRLIQMATLGRVHRFTEFPALTNISLDIRRGETVGIVGRNGCGKSTLLQIICGTLQPTSGTVEVQGRIAALLELGAGFNGEFTGRENVYMNGAILGFSREEMDARFEQIAAFAAIGDFIERPVKTYSSGMFVRLAFAVATAVEPEILVVDEALAVGDEAFQRKCFARIEAIKERGGTVLFVSHSAPMVVQLCDRAVLLDGGEKLLEGRPKRVTAQYQRLVNASAEAAAEIRASIVEMAPDIAAGAQTGDASGARAVSPEIQAASPAEMQGARPQPSGDSRQNMASLAVESPSAPWEDADYLDPALVPQSTAEQEKRGARIRDIRILTIGGEPVNVLRTGKRYVIEYATDFSVDAREVGFGIGITTVEGAHMSGTSCRGARTKQVRATGSILSRFEFLCVFLPGHYFVTCQVRGNAGEGEVPLHRVVDAAVFRVAAQGDGLSVGRIDMSPIVSLANASGPKEQADAP